MRNFCLIGPIALSCATIATVACDPTPSEPPVSDEVSLLQAALVDDDDEGAIFLAPSDGGHPAIGDVVVTSNPTVKVIRLGANEQVIADFVRDPGVSADRRIELVLQEDQSDNDFDFNPVGYFQAKWDTTTSMPVGRYRLRVSLPDGRAAGHVDVVLAATKKDLKNQDLSGAFGFVRGKAVKLRFRIDSPQSRLPSPS